MCDAGRYPINQQVEDLQNIKHPQSILPFGDRRYITVYDFLKQSTELMRQAAKIGEINPDVLEQLSGPGRVTSFRFPLTIHGQAPA